MAGRWDTIVVGSGAGGLVASLGLARRGRSVLVLEAGKQLGGMLNPFARGPYHFDVGVHYLGEAGPGQAMRRLLDSLGLEGVCFREIDPDCIDRYVFDGYEGRLVKGIERWIDRLAADFPHERGGLRRFQRILEAATTVSRMTLDRPTVADVARVVRGSVDLARLLRMTWAELLLRLVDDPMLRNVLSGPGGDIALPPSRASALYMVLLFGHYLGGAHYPVGGSGAMRDAFVEGLRAHGADLRRNQRVERIIVHDDHHFEVVTATGERHEARSVVSNADAHLTLDMIEGARPGLLSRRKMAHMRPSLGALCVFLATDLDLPAAGITDANIWHYGTDDIEKCYAAVLEGRLADEPFFFLTAPTLKDPGSGRAPAGQHTLELISFVPNHTFQSWFDRPLHDRGDEYEALKERLTAQLVEGAERYVPGLRSHLLHREAATPATLWHFVRGREGGVYGPEHTPDQVAPRRLLPSIGVPGLYLCGASVIGCGVMACMTSGQMAARDCERHLASTRAAWPGAALGPSRVLH